MKKIDSEDIVIKSYNSISVDTSRIDCDYYRINAKDNNSLKQYMGEFMTQYPWAEETVGYLDRLVHGNS